jgi:hypothetical protein
VGKCRLHTPENTSTRFWLALWWSLYTRSSIASWFIPSLATRPTPRAPAKFAQSSLRGHSAHWLALLGLSLTFGIRHRAQQACLHKQVATWAQTEVACTLSGAATFLKGCSKNFHVFEGVVTRRQHWDNNTDCSSHVRHVRCETPAALTHLPELCPRRRLHQALSEAGA